MSDPVQAAERYREEFAERGESLPGHGLPWLRDLRRRALDRFVSTGFPGPRLEAWKYTSVRPIVRREFSLSAETVHVDPDRVAGCLFPDMPCYLLVFVNGFFCDEMSEIPASLDIQPLSRVLSGDAETIRPYMADGNGDEAAAFEALNTAFMQDGAFIRIERDASLDRPVHLLFLSDDGQERPSMTHIRNFIIAEPGSRATIIESYAGDESVTRFMTAVTDVMVEENAGIEHYRLQEEGLKSFHIGAIRVRQAGDSSYLSHNISLGAALARTDIRAEFTAGGADCSLNGLYVVGGRQHSDQHTRIDHAVPACTSREFYRGVVDGQGHAVFNGKLVVHDGAEKTDASQTNHNLLLSADAEVDTKPELEIYADDVRCTHGATIGQLDDESVFYLRSRGIGEELARSILTFAFADDVIRRMPLEPVRARLENIIIGRMPGGPEIREML
jgi:Fe-S cluster assembly protein SufD